MRSIPVAILAALTIATGAQAQRFNAIWGASANDVWAVGDGGIAAHYNGQGWVSANTGATTDLRAVWASGPRDVWAVGDDGTILHMTGSAWTWVRPLVSRHFVAVGGCAANDVWVIGQSREMSQPPAVLHFDGSNWTFERAPFPFRPAGMAVACVSGSGGGGPAIAGVAYFDPTPTQRRDIGVLMRRNGSSWTTQGFDGHTMTDPQIGGAAWTSISSGGGVTLMAGQNAAGQPVILISRGGGAFSPLAAPTVPNVDADAFRFTVAGDGTPLALFESGFARYTGGRWAVVTADAASGQTSQTDAAAYAQLAQQMQAKMARGEQPTAQEIQQMQSMGQQISQRGMNAMAAASKAQTLAFGRDPSAWAPTGTNIFVGAHNQFLMHVTGDSSEIVWTTNCSVAQMASLEPCSNHAARQSVPTPVSGPKPDAPPETAAQQAAPAAPSMPSVPRIGKPRIPRP